MLRVLLASFLTLCALFLEAQNFEWVQTVGDFGDDVGVAIAVDNWGNVYTMGSFEGTVDFDPGPGIANHTAVGTYDIFIQKLSAGGSFLWAKSFGGSIYENGLSMAVDRWGNVFTAGEFTGTIDSDPGPGTTNLVGASPFVVDIFIQKLDSAGNFLWAKSLGSSATSESVRSISADVSGNIVLTGYFDGTIDFNPGTGVNNLSTVGNRDIFLLKLDMAGNFLWAKSFGSNDNDNGFAITTDRLGNIYTTGYFDGWTDFDPGSGIFNLGSKGNQDVFIHKVDSSGNFLWARAFGGQIGDFGQSIAVDNSGNVYTVGDFIGTVDFDPGPGTTNLLGGSSSYFVQKLDSSGNFLWANSVGGSASTSPASVTLDPRGIPYTITRFNFIDKLDTAGNVTWSGFSGGYNSASITSDFLGNIYVTGNFSGIRDFDPGPGTTNRFSSGKADLFVQKFSKCDPDITTTVNSMTITSNSTIATYQWLDCTNGYAIIQGDTNQSFTVPANGSYAVELTNGSCIDTSACVLITTVGINELSNDIKISTFPNPTKERLHINFSQELSHVGFTITDIQGKVLSQSTGKRLINTSIKVPEKKGVYFLTIKTNKGKKTLKIIKE